MELGLIERRFQCLCLQDGPGARGRWELGQNTGAKNITNSGLYAAHCAGCVLNDAASIKLAMNSQRPKIPDPLRLMKVLRMTDLKSSRLRIATIELLYS